ncbi:MAG TPA: hypothetical protein VNP04_27235 [Alphaproteobacteria bacterium]|nr:hypothetical protein [Alphaproteobacteria bacterium]
MRRPTWKQIVFTLASVFVVAFLLNWAILALFGQKSADRAVHSLVGILMLMGYVYLFVRRQAGGMGPLPFFALALIPCYLGTVFPDLDIALLGIRAHRHPLFHSSLSFFLLLALVGRRRAWLRPLIAGYGVGLASHLWWDVVDYGDVRWLPGGLLDRLWLAGNGWVCLVTGHFHLNNPER